MTYDLSDRQGRTLCRSRLRITCVVSGPNELGRYDFRIAAQGETLREETGALGETSRESAIQAVTAVLEIAVAKHAVDVPGVLTATDIRAIQAKLLAGTDTVETALLLGA